MPGRTKSFSRNLNSTFGVGRWAFDVFDFDSLPPFSLNAFEQFRVIPIKLVREFHGVFQRVGIHLKTFPQFAGSR
ncbi:MAG: hypothetical protein DME27_08335, partial [Verrucomicrobia bacterium]